jgi:hypothetical protein
MYFKPCDRRDVQFIAVREFLEPGFKHAHLCAQRIHHRHHHFANNYHPQMRPVSANDFFERGSVDPRVWKRAGDFLVPLVQRAPVCIIVFHQAEADDDEILGRNDPDCLAFMAAGVERVPGR